MQSSPVVDDTLLAEIRRMMAILDVDSVLLFFKDVDGVYREVNNAYCWHAGKPYNEIIGKNDFELFDLEETTRYRAVDLAILETGQPKIEDWLSESRGVGRWFHVIKTRVTTATGQVAGIFGQAVDITDTKRNEESLRASQDGIRRSETRMKKAQEIAGVGDWVWDIRQSDITWSDQMFRIFGIDPNNYTGRLGNAIARVIHPDDLYIVLPENAARFASQKSVEYRIILPDGSIRHILAEKGEVLLNEQGYPVYMTGTCQDVTAQRHAEFERERQFGLIQSILDTIPDFLILKDRDLVYREVNKAFCTYLGRSRDEIVGKTDVELFGEANGQVYQASDREVLETGRVIAIDEESHITGSLHWLHVIKSPVAGPDGQPAGVLCSIQDITLRRKLEDALMETSETYRASFEDSQAVKLIINPEDGRIVQANRAASRFYGYSLEELKNKKVSDVNTAPHESLVKRLDEARTKQQAFFNFTHRLASGELRDVEVYSGPVQTGEKVLLHSIVHDVTERKLADDVVQASLRLHEVAAGADLDLMIQAGLDIAEEMTGSQISFFHFVEDDQKTLVMQNWSTRTRAEICKAEIRDIHYNLEDAGVWADCIRERHPVIHNDYAGMDGRKGLPAGHAPLVRELVVPGFHDERIVAVIGVGNKPGEYTQRDRLFLERFAVAAWDLAMIRRKDLEIRRSEEQLRSVLAAAPDMVFSIDRELRLLFINKLPPWLRMEDVIGVSALNFIDPVYHTQVQQKVEGLFRSGKPDKCTLQALSMLGEMRWFENHMAPVFENGEVKAVLVTSLDIHDRIQIEEDLRKTSAELFHAYEATLQGWSQALELRERETAGHSKRVVEMTLELAQVMDVPIEAMVHVRRGALLHDAGKLGIPDNILLKPGSLTPDEWVIMRQHPVYAYRLLSPIEYLKPALDIPYCHHERWDGSGYPRGLKGEEIPLAARIFAVVDVWDALLSNRPYRPAWDETAVLDYLQEQAGKQFDPAVVAAFMGMITEGVGEYAGQASFKGRLAPQ